MDVTYCIWDNDSCSVQKTKHLHKIMPPEGSLHRPQDTHSETPCLNWLGQRPEHPVHDDDPDVRLILQAGMLCSIFHSTATLLPFSSWHQSDQTSKNQGPVCHPSLQDKSNNLVGNFAIQQQQQSYPRLTIFGKLRDCLATWPVSHAWPWCAKKNVLCQLASSPGANKKSCIM